MANITLSIADALKHQMALYDEVRWSEVAKKAIVQKLYEMRKVEILQKYLNHVPFSADDLKWMDQNDWHPVDERPMRKEFVHEVLKERGRSGKRMSLKGLLG